ncbi:hypothetical protein RUM44_005519 [Polyplax serrata]|uniref:Uncharacterized protein n=1 Tax=Polyplax serrata TaxID=468196 RepID=A0ABR1AEW9_POLSC
MNKIRFVSESGVMDGCYPYLKDEDSSSTYEIQAKVILSFSTTLKNKYFVAVECVRQIEGVIFPEKHNITGIPGQ